MSSSSSVSNTLLKSFGRDRFEMTFVWLRTQNTMARGWQQLNPLHLWRVDRHNEASRFAKHDALDNRKLLWHGTNVAVVAAILKSGLRIMPHSGGRVGKVCARASCCVAGPQWSGCRTSLPNCFGKRPAGDMNRTHSVSGAVLVRG